MSIDRDGSKVQDSRLKSEPQNRRTLNNECRRKESLRSVFFIIDRIPSFDIRNSSFDIRYSQLKTLEPGTSLFRIEHPGNPAFMYFSGFFRVRFGLVNKFKAGPPDADDIFML